MSRNYEEEGLVFYGRGQEGDEMAESRNLAFKGGMNGKKNMK